MEKIDPVFNLETTSFDMPSLFEAVNHGEYKSDMGYDRMI